MRVLWFTNDPLPAVQRRLGRPESQGTGHWITSLLEHLSRIPEVQIEIATAYPALPDDEFQAEGIRYFVMSQPRWPYVFSMSRRADLDRCARLVHERTPDVVHIHGSERFYGLIAARELISTPCLISLQGLAGPYVRPFFGALSPLEIWRSHRLFEIATLRGLLWLRCAFVLAARHEQEILRAAAPIFLGRTNWDRAHLRSVNSTARYRHVGEVLRTAYRDLVWEVRRCEPHSIIFTNAGLPRRGTEVLLRAMLIILRNFPDARLRLAGTVGTRRGYERFLRRMIAQMGLTGVVDLLGYLDAPDMAKELHRSHVFAITSYIENSPNSLCEAMQVGMPCVATFAGGIPSLVDHGRTGLLVPTGDAPSLADAIMRIFSDDDLACRLARAARQEASQRHNPQLVVSQLLTAYDEAIGEAARSDANLSGSWAAGEGTYEKL